MLFQECKDLVHVLVCLEQRVSMTGTLYNIKLKQVMANIFHQLFNEHHGLLDRYQ